MSDAARTPERQGELEFPRARNQIEAELESFLGDGAGGVQKPAFSFEKGETKFAFPAPRIDPERVFQAMGALKTQIENLRIHTFEPGYIIFQDLGPNLYSSQRSSPTDGIKFKFISISSAHRIEVTRRGNFNQDEVQACIALFKLFHPAEQAANPAEDLKKLGVTVYQGRSEREDGPPVPADGSENVRTSTPEGAEGGESSGRESINIGKRYGFAGYKKTRQEILESVILPLKRPDVFRDVARATRGVETGSLPRAVLFEGPPGVGKTTMARIAALETGIPLLYVPVENILSKFYGESAQNMAAIFDAAASYERVILFLDEIDSLAGSREDGLFEATRRILSVLLRKIDGFESRDGVLTIGATNRAGDLDRALLSRFDTIISFPLPDGPERAAIFRRYAGHLNDEELTALSRAAEGLSGRSIQDICEYAERRQARQLIASGRPASPPPAELYLEIAREKATQQTTF